MTNNTKLSTATTGARIEPIEGAPDATGRRARLVPAGLLRDGREPTLVDVTDRAVRRNVRSALAHHLGLDIPAAADGA